MKTKQQWGVLLVDDDEDWLLLIGNRLRTLGFTVTKSLNGKDLWEKIKQQHPDIILLDIHMQSADGEIFCRSLKKDPATAHIPVLMYSANDDIGSVATRCGADGYLPKTTAPEIVKETLLRYVA